ncbi:winged helix-turn-helix domain-containing protein [Arthrobacter sp. CAN_A1]|uniref:winged helix-turn-helix domain-containing protein n=1 Tax=Arthrobacter sp. CAN_A1 TaxID=2787717 RepID=UPI0018CBB6CC
MFVLTNHARVLLCLSANPRARLRDIAEIMGMAERAEQRIVAELEVAGYLDQEGWRAVATSTA